MPIFDDFKNIESWQFVIIGVTAADLLYLIIATIIFCFRRSNRRKRRLNVPNRSIPSIRFNPPSTTDVAIDPISPAIDPISSIPEQMPVIDDRSKPKSKDNLIKSDPSNNRESPAIDPQSSKLMPLPSSASASIGLSPPPILDTSDLDMPAPMITDLPKVHRRRKKKKKTSDESPKSDKSFKTHFIMQIPVKRKAATATSGLRATSSSTPANPVARKRKLKKRRRRE